MTTQNRAQRRAQEAMNRRAQNARQNAGSGEIKPDNGWDELHTLYLECRALTTQPANVLPLITNKVLVDKLADKGRLEQVAGVLSRDAHDFNQRLDTIYARHSARTGSTVSADDLMQCVTVGEAYAEWMFSYQSVVLPNVHTILEMFDEIQNGPKVAVEGEYIPAAQ